MLVRQLRNGKGMAGVCTPIKLKDFQPLSIITYYLKEKARRRCLNLPLQQLLLPLLDRIHESIDR